MTHKLAVVIPVSNHWDLTRDCLLYLYQHTDYKPDWIIVVDDGSTDETEERLKATTTEPRSIPLVVVRHEEQQGFARACNAGMRQAMQLGATHVLLLNNDVEAWDPQWLRQIMDAFEQDANVVVGKDYVDYNSAAIVDDEAVPYVGGWCMAFPLRLVQQIGMFDEALSPAFYEDVELCARAQAAGYQLVGLGETLGIHHLYGRTSLDGRLDVDEIHIRNQPVFQDKVRALRAKPGEDVNVAGMRFSFYCPGNMVFDDLYLEHEGLGGAEGALVQLTRALAAQGADVHVFNDCPQPGVFHGVRYHELRDPDVLGSEGAWDAFVLFRVTPTSEIWDVVDAKARLFWSCDQYTTMDWREHVFPYVDKVVAISPYHRQFLIEHWGADPAATVDLPLGVTVADFTPALPKVRNRMIYCSVPRRGLQWLAGIFPRVKECIPGASLVVTGDYTLWGSPTPQNEEYRAMFEGMEDVHFLGKVPRARLLQEMLQAELHVYPCDYQCEIPYTGTTVEGENFCVASLECQAAGTPTIATPNGALRTTVEDGMSGYLIKGHYPGEEFFTQRFVNVIEDLLVRQRPVLEQMSKYARRRALTRYSWAEIAKRWARLVKETANGRSTTASG